MGAGQSKPEESTKHVFASDTPIQFSQEYVQLTVRIGLRVAMLQSIGVKLN